MKRRKQYPHKQNNNLFKLNSYPSSHNDGKSGSMQFLQEKDNKHHRLNSLQLPEMREGGDCKVQPLQENSCKIQVFQLRL